MTNIQAQTFDLDDEGFTLLESDERSNKNAILWPEFALVQI